MFKAYIIGKIEIQTSVFAIAGIAIQDNQLDLSVSVKC